MIEPAVVVVGSIGTDFIVTISTLPTRGETVVGGTLVHQGGGKSANQAVAASRVGADTVFVGAVGKDDLGPAALEGLVASGVDTSASLELEGAATAVALIMVDAAGENQIAVAPGAGAILDGAMVGDSLRDIEPRPGAVCLLCFEVGDEAVEAAARWAADQGMVIVLNPAPARSIPPAILEFGPILTPNETEVAMLSGASEPESGARVLAAQTGAPVIVTLGSEGALLLADEQAHRIPALPVVPLDSTGAGDALNGILSAELAAGAPIAEALRWAVTGASLSTKVQGAQAGAPTRAAIEARLG